MMVIGDSNFCLSSEPSNMRGGGMRGGFGGFHDPEEVFRAFFGGADPFAEFFGGGDPFGGDPFGRTSRGGARSGSFASRGGAGSFAGAGSLFGNDDSTEGDEAPAAKGEEI